MDILQEEAFLKKALAKFGIVPDINEAIKQLAGTIRDHDHMERLVTETEPEMRQAFYDSVRPHLKFKAKPMDIYISDAKQRADRMQLPILHSGGRLEPYRPTEVVLDVEAAMLRSAASRRLTLTCSKCTKEEHFFGLEAETPVAVVIKARRAGWVYNPVSMTEHCPACMGVAQDA